MRSSVLFFLLLLACVYLILAQGAYENCCLKYVKGVKKSTKKSVVNYRRQETDGGCNIPAVVFTLKKGRMFCADPNYTWVKQLMQAIDRRTTRQAPRPVKR